MESLKFEKKVLELELYGTKVNLILMDKPYTRLTKVNLKFPTSDEYMEFSKQMGDVKADPIVVTYDYLEKMGMDKGLIGQLHPEHLGELMGVLNAVKK